MAKDFIESYQNLFLKEEDPAQEDPDLYNGLVFNINRYLSMDDAFLVPVAYVTKYISILRGRYYHLLYTLIPDLGRKVFNKWIKNTALDHQEKHEVEAISRMLSVNMKDGFIARRVLIHKGVDVKAMIGTIPPKKEKKVYAKE